MYVFLLQYPPKYEYNYFVANKDDQASQGHKESRNGDNTSGNYYVNLPQAQATINYIADDWGYHPVVRYFINSNNLFYIIIIY